MNSLKCKWQSSLRWRFFFSSSFVSTFGSGLISVSSSNWGSWCLGTPSLEPELGPEATIGSSSGYKGWLGTSNLVSGEIGFLTFFLGTALAGFGSCASSGAGWLLEFLATFFVRMWTMFTITCCICNFFGLKAVHRFPTGSCKSHNVKNWMIGCTDR